MAMWKEERPYDCSPSSEETREVEAERGRTRKKRKKKTIQETEERGGMREKRNSWKRTKIEKLKEEKVENEEK